jgi:hypothetical protein
MEREEHRMRIRTTDGLETQPQWHPNVERVAVSAGTFRLDGGQEPKIEAPRPLEPVHCIALPPETHHYQLTHGRGVVQIFSIGPWEMAETKEEEGPRVRA